MVKNSPNLWNLVQSQHWLDPDELLEAIDQESRLDKLDYRTRLLIRDGLQALDVYWGTSRLNREIAQCNEPRLRGILQETFEKIGFPSLQYRVVKPMDSAFFERIFRKLGDKLRHAVSIPIGGSTSLILQGMLRRVTEDIDIVDEMPVELRENHALMDELQRISKITIAHFQRHYLPIRWENRAHWYGQYGNLTVSLVDATDIFLSKLFSIREKDMLDMEILLPQLDRQVILERLKHDCTILLDNETYRERATKNWYILTGETLAL